MSTQHSRSNSLSGLYAFSDDGSTTTSGGEMMAGIVSPTSRRHSTIRQHSPVVQAMLTSNTLRDCRQVEEMFTKCMSHASADMKDSFMCRTAELYFTNCSTKK